MSTTLPDIDQKTYAAETRSNMLAPRLRFKDFEGKWNSTTVGEHVISSAFGPRFSSNLYSDSGNILTLRTTDMDNDGNICYDKVPLAKLKLGELKEHILLKGDLVISRSGTIGVTGIFQGYSIPVIPGAFLIRFRFKKDGLSPDFVRLYFNCSKGRNEIESLSAGGVQKNLTGSSVLKMSLVVPALPEQQKIASFLSAVDEKIQQLTRKKELLEQYKKGVMQHLFSGKLRFKPALSEVEGDENGEDFPDWEEKRLGDVLEIGSGRDYKHLSVGDVPVFGTGGLMTKVNDFLYDGETVCIGRKGTIDKPMFYNGKIWTVDTLFYTHKFKNSIPKFIYFLFQQVNWKLYNEASGVPSLSKATIEKLKFIFPSIEEQQKIATYLSGIDTKIESVTNQITQTQRFKKGLLQQMFV